MRLKEENSIILDGVLFEEVPEEELKTTFLQLDIPILFIPKTVVNTIEPSTEFLKGHSYLLDIEDRTLPDLAISKYHLVKKMSLEYGISADDFIFLRKSID